MAISASVMLSVLSSCRDSRVIDEEDMAQIYAEMLMTDQWISSTPDIKRIADTSLVYEPILRKYGYTSEDYRFSIDYYLGQDDEFAEIMRKTVEILDDRKAVLENKRLMLEEEKKIKDYIKEIAKDISIHESIYAINRPVSEKTSPDDSLTVQWDTLALCFKLSWKSSCDTLSIKDSLKDSNGLGVLKMDTLKRVIDTTKRISKMDEMRPVKAIKPIDGKELKAVKDAYLLN